MCADTTNDPNLGSLLIVMPAKINLAGIYNRNAGSARRRQQRLQRCKNNEKYRAHQVYTYSFASSLTKVQELIYTLWLHGIMFFDWRMG
ncbi:hypothetical protein F8M41_014471 [Gigaspora margarita]|uniref:Uncharacterized protein n=1 Tax=Gigaspora margarita TaxID=4874 RepID=A0A8H3ZYA5_GIGMA|nr:hypothetical protein F8M41_014471 [Gigaspora margarita]